MPLINTTSVRFSQVRGVTGSEEMALETFLYFSEGDFAFTTADSLTSGYISRSNTNINI